MQTRQDQHSRSPQQSASCEAGCSDKGAKSGYIAANPPAEISPFLPSDTQSILPQNPDAAADQLELSAVGL